MIFVVENSLQAANFTAKVPSSEEGGDRRFYDHRREPYMSQDQAVTAPLRTSTFKSELNDAVGLCNVQSLKQQPPVSAKAFELLAQSWAGLWRILHSVQDQDTLPTNERRIIED